MHSYLRSIGFSNVKTRGELEQIIGMVMQEPTANRVIEKEEKIKATEISRDFGTRFGLTIRGEYDEKGFFHLEHYFPYLKGRNISLKEDIIINKKVDTDSYTAMCDDIRLGVSLIFYLQNALDYKQYKTTAAKHILMPILLSGLSISGKVILGLEKAEKDKKETASDSMKRNRLIAEARKGDQEAIDSLTIDDIDLYAMVSRRAKVEDVYSIVDTCFVPYGSESDNYSVVGTILEVEEAVNEITQEKIYELLLDCNGLTYNICINQKDLLGEPAAGRRFKGTIWMQGMIQFLE